MVVAVIPNGCSGRSPGRAGMPVQEDQSLEDLLLEPLLTPAPRCHVQDPLLMVELHRTALVQAPYHRLPGAADLRSLVSQEQVAAPGLRLSSRGTSHWHQGSRRGGALRGVSLTGTRGGPGRIVHASAVRYDGPVGIIRESVPPGVLTSP